MESFCLRFLPSRPYCHYSIFVHLLVSVDRPFFQQNYIMYIIHLFDIIRTVDSPKVEHEPKVFYFVEKSIKTLVQL